MADVPNENELRTRFKQSGRTSVMYAKARDLNRHTLARVLDGEYTGKRRDKHVVKVIEALIADGIWLASSPWDNVQSKAS